MFKIYNQAHYPLLHKIINPAHNELSCEKDPAKVFSKIFTYFNNHLWNESTTEIKLLQYLQKNLKVTLELTDLQEKTLGLENVLKDLESVTNIISTNNTIKYLFYCSVLVKNVVISMNQIIAKADSITHLDYHIIKDQYVSIFGSYGNLYLCTAGEGAAIYIDNTLFNLTKEGLLCLSDLIHQRFNLFVSCLLGSIYNLPQYPTIEDLTTFLN